MEISFLKYQGAGNDFILLDNRDRKYSSLNKNLIYKLCDRRFGIGADGLMLLENHPDFDFQMHYYNADGGLGSMCGNGGRCIVAFAHHLKIIDTETNFLAVDGPHYAKITQNPFLVELQMIDVEEFRIDKDATILNTGSPHYILPVADLPSLNVYEKGRNIRYSDEFKAKGINVNFSEWKDNILHVRTYERGVEGETFACGTGVTAAAMAHALKHQLEGDIDTKISVLGGELNVKFKKTGNGFTNVFLIGPAELVFNGTINII